MVQAVRDRVEEATIVAFFFIYTRGRFGAIFKGYLY